MSAVLELEQGSAAWHEHRAQHRNASDAPAMMGCSPYESRSQLLHRLHTGIAPEVDAATQRRFDIGHRSEAMCRPLAEQILEEDLAPRVVTAGALSASLDGSTLLCDIDWEHKALNEELRRIIPVLSEPVAPPHVGKALPMLYRVQVAQQQHCSGARRTLFSASLWTTDGELVEARHCWIDRDEALIAKVIAGWAQAEKDLAAYVPPEAAPQIVAAPQEHLPAVSVQVSGALAVVSNFAVMAPRLRAYIERIPKAPSTDQEFADVEAACKRLREAQVAIEGAVNGALASIADVNELRRIGGELAEAARAAALAGEKAVKTRKDELRVSEVERGRRALAAHVAEIDAHLGGRYMPPPLADFALAIKGLKTLDSIRNAIDTALAQAKIAADAMGQRIMDNLHTLMDAGHAALFADKAQLVLKDPEAVAAIVAQRVAEHKAAEERRLEAERARIRAEEVARVEREQAAARAAQEAKDAAERSANAPVQQPVQVAEAARPGGGSPPPPDTPAPAAPTAAAAAGPIVTIGALCDLVGPAGGFKITQQFVESLGVSVKTERAAKFVDQAAVIDALIKHLQDLRQ